MTRNPNCAARGNPVPVGIDGRTAPKLPKLVVIRLPFGSLDTPASTCDCRSHPASPPSDVTVNPAGSVANVGSVPLNGDDGRPAGPTRLEMLNALNSCAVASTLHAALELQHVRQLDVGRDERIVEARAVRHSTAIRQPLIARVERARERRL